LSLKVVCKVTLKNRFHTKKALINIIQVKAYLKQRRAGSENARKLLESAVLGKPMTAAQEQVVAVNDQLIENVLANMSSNFSRLSNVLKKVGKACNKSY